MSQSGALYLPGGSSSHAAGGRPVEAFSTAFPSEGCQIRVDVHRPKAAPNSPGLLFYHGSCGIDPYDGCIRGFAEAAADRGFTALIVHYFDRTGTTSANMATVLRHSERWISAVSDAVTFASADLAVDPERVAAVGYSLGGFLAVAHAARDQRIRANVVISGGIDPFTARSVKRLPPTWVIHGEDDVRVPLQKAVQLCEALEKLHVPVHSRFLPGEGHVLSAEGTAGALTSAFEFLSEHLQPRLARV